VPEGAERDALFQKPGGPAVRALRATLEIGGDRPGRHMAATLEIDAVIDPADMPQGAPWLVDPDGLLEFSVVYTDRALNHMSAVSRA
jgi:hypothetical protein